MYRVIYHLPYADESESIGFRKYEEALEEAHDLARNGIGSSITHEGEVIDDIEPLRMALAYETN